MHWGHLNTESQRALISLHNIKPFTTYSVGSQENTPFLGPFEGIWHRFNITEGNFYMIIGHQNAANKMREETQCYSVTAQGSSAICMWVYWPTKTVFNLRPVLSRQNQSGLHFFFFFVGSSNSSSTGCLFSALCSLLSVPAQLQLSA